MNDIIELLEKATGPDRELDGLVFEAAGGEAWRKAFARAARPSGAPIEVCQKDARLMAPAFTASIDAALTLVPKGFSYELTQSAAEPPALARCRLWDWRRGPLMIDPDNEWKSEGNQPLAIHICMAAFKARAHS